LYPRNSSGYWIRVANLSGCYLL